MLLESTSTVIIYLFEDALLDSSLARARMLKKERLRKQGIVRKMSEPNAPRTTPECKRLESMVIAGFKSNPFEADKKEAARVALKRLRKNRCVKSLEYIIQVTSERNIFDAFAKEVFDTATKYLNELS